MRSFPQRFLFVVQFLVHFGRRPGNGDCSVLLTVEVSSGFKGVYFLNDLNGSLILQQRRESSGHV